MNDDGWAWRFQIMVRWLLWFGRTLSVFGRHAYFASMLFPYTEAIIQR
jgi:hypothetical protein